MNARQVYLLAKDGSATRLRSLGEGADEGVPEYRTLPTGVRVAMLRGACNGLLPVPLSRLQIVIPAPDRVDVPAEALGDLVTAAELAGYELLSLAARMPSQDAAERCMSLAARLGHALSAAMDYATTRDPWQGR